MSDKRPAGVEKVFGAGVGRAIADRRAKQKLSGPQLAGRSGVSIDTIRSLETGRIGSPGLYAMTLLSGVLDVSLDDLAAAGTTALSTVPPIAEDTATAKATPTSPEATNPGATDD